MRLCYQVATPDVTIAPSVTAYQGNLERSFQRLKECGYHGIELMTRDPQLLNVNEIKDYCIKYNLNVTMICTGEVFGQDKLYFTAQDETIREASIKRICDIIDFAAEFGASVNLGRVKGFYYDGVSEETIYRWAVEGLKKVSEYAKTKNVEIVVEPVTIMQTNFINTTGEGINLIKDVGMDNLKLMLDIFHMNIEEKNIIESIEASRGYIGYVHLSDNNRRAPGNCGLDFKAILKALKEKGAYDGAVSVEVFQLPDQDWALEYSIKHLKPIVDELNVN
jgi:sugar phosphate isomerase/epimerase